MRRCEKKNIINYPMYYPSLTFSNNNNIPNTCVIPESDLPFEYVFNTAGTFFGFVNDNSDIFSNYLNIGLNEYEHRIDINDEPFPSFFISALDPLNIPEFFTIRNLHVKLNIKADAIYNAPPGSTLRFYIAIYSRNQTTDPYEQYDIETSYLIATITNFNNIIELTIDMDISHIQNLPNSMDFIFVIAASLYDSDDNSIYSPQAINFNIMECSYIQLSSTIIP